MIFDYRRMDPPTLKLLVTLSLILDLFAMRYESSRASGWEEGSLFLRRGRGQFSRRVYASFLSLVKSVKTHAEVRLDR
jgi:hypothetical protein